ncbi:uncharacterized protein EHS24_003811 [Apiotrichum porosum]|uniref:CENP-V/GFA domain-containing protein n=1 Tax=Apiotrichum porosum TaxID=105984 RepID=A0A427XEN1_9TREE|nr:uncharacterized protein EHS24_003811 [Apiotrichum porosum]RSH77174.1 hypothetical protein EHS24_003811 [Apiotrichum porosum]
MSTSPHYSAIAQRAIELFQFYSDANPSARSTHAASEPSSADGLPALDFDVRTLQAEDRYLYGNFVDGTWVSKLESDVEGEQGMYNVAVDPTLRTAYTFILPTKDYHEQSAPVRPAYLTHAHRLLVALEEELGPAGHLGEGKVVAVSDPRVEAFTALLNGTPDSPEPFIPKTPHYNMILSREEMVIVPRDDDGAAYLLECKHATTTVAGECKSFTTTADSGNRATRYSCAVCNSCVWDQYSNPDELEVHSGIFPPGSIAKPALEIFMRNAETWETPHACSQYQGGP